MLSLDDSSMRGTIDENSSSWQSDHGRAAREIYRVGMKWLIDSTISQLPKQYCDFARDVLDGKSWEDLQMPKRTFNWRVKKVCFLIAHLPPKSSLER